MDDFVWPENTTPNHQKLLSQVLWALADAPVEDSSGRAVGVLAELITLRGGPELTTGRLTTLLKELELAPYGLVKRHMNVHRTHRIELTVDHTQSPFPPDPFAKRRGRPPKSKTTPKATPANTNGKARQVPPADEDQMLRDLMDAAVRHDETAKKVEAVTLTPAPVVPHGDLGVSGEHSIHELLLFAISAINDAIIQMSVQPAFDLENLLAGRISALDKLMERNAELSRDLDRSRRDIQTLTRANQQLQGMLQARR